MIYSLSKKLTEDAVQVLFFLFSFHINFWFFIFVCSALSAFTGGYFALYKFSLLLLLLSLSDQKI